MGSIYPGARSKVLLIKGVRPVRSPELGRSDFQDLVEFGFFWTSALYNFPGGGQMGLVCAVRGISTNGKYTVYFL